MVIAWLLTRLIVVLLLVRELNFDDELLLQHDNLIYFLLYWNIKIFINLSIKCELPTTYRSMLSTKFCFPELRSYHRDTTLHGEGIGGEVE